MNINTSRYRSNSNVDTGKFGSPSENKNRPRRHQRFGVKSMSVMNDMDLDTMKMSDEEIQMALQLGIQLTEENGDLQKQLEQLQLKNDNLLQNIVELNDGNDRLVNTNTDIIAQNNSLQATIMKLEEKTGVLQGEIEELQKLKNTLPQMADSSYETIISDKERVITQFVSATMDKEELERQLKQAHSRAQVLQTHLDNGKTEIEDLTAKLQETVRAQEESQSTISHLQRKLKEKEGMYSTAKQDIIAKEEYIIETKQIHQNNERELKMEIQRINDKITSMEDHNNNVPLHEQLLDEMRRQFEETNQGLQEDIRKGELREYRLKERIEKLTQKSESDTESNKQSQDDSDVDQSMPSSARSAVSEVSGPNTPRQYVVPPLVPSLSLTSVLGGSQQQLPVQPNSGKRHPQLSRTSSTSSMLVSPRQSAVNPQLQHTAGVASSANLDNCPTIYGEHFRLLFQSIRLQLEKEDQYRDVAFLLWAFDSHVWYIECLTEEISIDAWFFYIFDRCVQFLENSKEETKLLMRKNDTAVKPSSNQ